MQLPAGPWNSDGLPDNVHLRHDDRSAELRYLLQPLINVLDLDVQRNADHPSFITLKHSWLSPTRAIHLVERSHKGLYSVSLVTIRTRKDSLAGTGVALLMFHLAVSSPLLGSNWLI